jgi:hypothetical protein
MSTDQGARPDAVTVEAALRRGQILVNGPGLILLVAGAAVVAYLAAVFHPWNWPFELHIVGVIVYPILAVAPAWIWWSIAVPKWRLWALKHVDNWPRLKASAIATLLIWPDTSPFTWTEIKPKAHAQAERELEIKWYPSESDGSGRLTR